MTEFLRCDTDGCDYTQDFEALTAEMVGVKCPKCGACLLTERDWQDFSRLRGSGEQLETTIVQALVSARQAENLCVTNHNGVVTVTFDLAHFKKVPQPRGCDTGRLGLDRIPEPMSAEEIRLEDLKQMAMYAGPIVSFEVVDPFYLASCDHCGWVGSTELCGFDSDGDDSDVYCPRCSASGADCGKVAARLSALVSTPAPLREDAEPWQWYAGSSNEWYQIGPCPTREAVIAEATAALLGEHQDENGKSLLGLHLVEAQRADLKLSKWIDVEAMIERANERTFDSDLATEYDDAVFDLSTEDHNELESIINATCDRWQRQRGLVFRTKMFTASRNAEYMVAPRPDAPNVDAGAE